jgi:hypothetical protein
MPCAGMTCRLASETFVEETAAAIDDMCVNQGRGDCNALKLTYFVFRDVMDAALTISSVIL